MNEQKQPAARPGLSKLLITCILLLVFSALKAQTVTGKVLDDEQKPVAGATITVKGTKRATASDNAGNFSITASANDVLQVSSIGFAPLEIPVAGKTNISVSMVKGDASSLDAVVVTALGIKRQERKLGYSTTTVKTEDLITNRTNNVGESMEGRVSGLNITPPSAGAGASSQIRIRGQVGFAGGTNSPLIVVNGNPMDQGARGTDGGGATRDQGDNLLNINPDDIESMTVLKGSTASALYGSRASAGAILITTKSGSKNSGIGVEYSTSYTTQKALNFMDQFQTVYGQGTGGLKPTSSAAAAGNGQFGWGAKLDGSLVPIFDGTSQPYIAYEDRLFDYLQTGTNFTNTLALSGGGANGSFRASVSTTGAKGIEPRDEFKRKIFNFGLNQNITSKLKFMLNLNWANEIQKNPPQVGVQGPGSVNFFTRLAINIPTSSLRDNAVNPSNGTEAQTSGFQGTLLNPYYANVAGQNWETTRDRILGTATLRYDIFNWLYVQGRYNYTYSNTFNETVIPFGIGTSAPQNADNTYKGSYNISKGSSTEINADFLVGGNKEFGDFSVDVSFGGNTYRAKGNSLNQGSTNFVVRDLYSIDNGNVKTQSYGFGRRRVNSLYGTAEFGYKRLLYLSLTGRNDWFSVYNPDNNDVFYPSASLSFVFSELMKKQEWLNYAKLRLAYAEAGSSNGVDNFEGILNYTIPARNFNGQVTSVVAGTFSPNAFLVPFSTVEHEIGLDARMFNNRFHIDIAGFKKVTTDQVLPVTLSNTSGYIQSKDNLASLRNSGIESLLEYTIIKKRDFNWISSWNNTYLSTKVLKVAPGLTDFLLINFNLTGNEFLGQVRYTEGLAMNQLYTRTYLRDDKGNILVNSAGRLLATPDYKPVGSSIPKYTGGWNNSFTYKNFNLNVFIDYKIGGTVLSGTALNNLRQGLSEASLVGRRDGETGIIVGTTQGGALPTGPVINQGTGQANTALVTDLQGFYADYRNSQIGDPFIFKSDFVKLRNISLAYNFTKLIQNSSYFKFIKGLTLSGSIRNVAILYKDLPGLDPEAIQSSGDTRVGYENAALPTTRSFNVSLNVKF